MWRTKVLRNGNLQTWPQRVDEMVGCGRLEEETVEEEGEENKNESLDGEKCKQNFTVH